MTLGHVAVVVGLIVAPHGRVDHEQLHGDALGLAGDVKDGVGDVLGPHHPCQILPGGRLGSQVQVWGVRFPRGDDAGANAMAPLLEVDRAGEGMESMLRGGVSHPGGRARLHTGA